MSFVGTNDILTDHQNNDSRVYTDLMKWLSKTAHAIFVLICFQQAECWLQYFDIIMYESFFGYNRF